MLIIQEFIIMYWITSKIFHMFTATRSESKHGSRKIHDRFKISENANYFTEKSLIMSLVYFFFLLFFFLLFLLLSIKFPLPSSPPSPLGHHFHPSLLSFPSFSKPSLSPLLHSFAMLIMRRTPTTRECRFKIMDYGRVSRRLFFLIIFPNNFIVLDFPTIPFIFHLVALFVTHIENIYIYIYSSYTRREF